MVSRMTYSIFHPFVVFRHMVGRVRNQHDLARRHGWDETTGMESVMCLSTKWQWGRGGGGTEGSNTCEFIDSHGFGIRQESDIMAECPTLDTPLPGLNL